MTKDGRIYNLGKTQKILTDNGYKIKILDYPPQHDHKDRSRCDECFVINAWTAEE